MSKEKGLLSKGAKDLDYEYEMLSYCRDELDCLGGVQEESKEDYLRRVMIESFLLHFRNLLNFTYPSPQDEERDFTAKDFCLDWEGVRRQEETEAWKKANITTKQGKNFDPEDREHMLGLKDQVSQNLAHLSASREESPYKWTYQGFYDALTDLLVTFTNAADQKHGLKEKCPHLPKESKNPISLLKSPVASTASTNTQPFAVSPKKLKKKG